MWMWEILVSSRTDFPGDKGLPYLFPIYKEHKICVDRGRDFRLIYLRQTIRLLGYL